jgi:outer membrane protein OmpA-like peptidoglycan-associated protein
VALSLIGKHALKSSLSSGSLFSWLGGQKDDIKKAIPSGFNLSSVFDDNIRKVSEPVHKAATYVEEKKNNWFLPLILGLLALGLLWYFMRSCNKPDEISAAPTPDTAVVATTVDTAKAAVVTTVRESLKVKLPDGTELDAWKGGIEDKLVTCLNDAACTVGKDVWFDFDDLNFEMASATLTAESNRQVKNIAAILKAYPKVKIKIGGYTDKTGDAAANKKLSQERATATATAIKASGASAAQVTGAEGYGSQFATVPAEASDAERLKDRHISISVREK